MRWLEGISDAMGMKLGKLREMVRAVSPDVLQCMGSKKAGHEWVTE